MSREAPGEPAPRTLADPGGLDVSAAAALDLSTVPAWQATARPSYVLRYSEGVLVQ